MEKILKENSVIWKLTQLHPKLIIMKLYLFPLLLITSFPVIAQNVGIGTTTPVAKLDVMAAPRTNTHPTNKVVYFTGDIGEGKTGDGGFEIRHSNATQGIGFGYNTIYQTGTQVNQELNIRARGTGAITLNAVGGATGNVGIGTVAPTAKLEVAGQVKITGGTPGLNKVLTSDATGLATWESPVVHFIGENYGGGIVFYVYDNGHHGLIAATADQSTGIGWYNTIFRYTGTTGDGLGAGAMNTAMIVATQMSDNQTGNFAAKLCADYSVTVGGVTYGDWYLPSIYEFNLLFLQRSIVGGFGLYNLYWSSTETTNPRAWFLTFNGGSTGTSPKENTYHVRAVRAF